MHLYMYIEHMYMLYNVHCIMYMHMHMEKIYVDVWPVYIYTHIHVYIYIHTHYTRTKIAPCAYPIGALYISAPQNITSSNEFKTKQCLSSPLT